MSEEIQEKMQADRQRILDARSKGMGATIKTYVNLSGPGWLQSAITLGGGSLAGSLYLGILGGYEMMWLQPLMMVFGIVMLSAISYVALSSGEKPFESLNQHVSPVLGWGWAIATLMANLVWAMPQFSLGTAALQQNLGILPGRGGEFAMSLFLFGFSAVVVSLYVKGGAAYRFFDLLLKGMVGVVVLSFFAVVFVMALKGGGLPWGDILVGFIPNPGLLFHPASSLQAFVDGSAAPDYWRETVVAAQRDRMVAAAATAVGINMTFLLPYSMLKRGWNRDFRGLAVFDLSTGLFLPFLVATSCVVIAAASQFHARPEPGLIGIHQPGAAIEVPAKLRSAYEGNLLRMLEATGKGAVADLNERDKPAVFAGLPETDRILAATMIERDAFALANSLETLAGKGIAQYVFGIGVVGMAISTIIILMLINGFVVCEMMGLKMEGMVYRIACLLPGISGALGALFLWSTKAKFYLAVPTSKFGMVLLPIAYIAFFCLMNNRKLLGDAMPRGGSRIVWNVLMGIGVALAVIGAAVSILSDSSRIPGTAVQVKHVVLGLVVALVALGFGVKATGSKR